MILVLWLARSLNWCAIACLRWSRRFDHASDVVYRPYYRAEARKARRDADRRALEESRRIGVVIEDLIAETRPVKRVSLHIHRDR